MKAVLVLCVAVVVMANAQEGVRVVDPSNGVNVVNNAPPAGGSNGVHVVEHAQPQGGNSGDDVVVIANPDPWYYKGPNEAEGVLIPNPDSFYYGGGQGGGASLANPDPYFSQGPGGNPSLRPYYRPADAKPYERNGK